MLAQLGGRVADVAHQPLLAPEMDARVMLEVHQRVEGQKPPVLARRVPFEAVDDADQVPVVVVDEATVQRQRASPLDGHGTPP
jgi:hypothetical protein